MDEFGSNYDDKKGGRKGGKRGAGGKGAAGGPTRNNVTQPFLAGLLEKHSDQIAAQNAQGISGKGIQDRATLQDKFGSNVEDSAEDPKQ